MEEKVKQEEKMKDVTGGANVQIPPEKSDEAPTIASVTPDGAVASKCCLPTLVHAGKGSDPNLGMPVYRPENK
jgi:hypothetical protein